jgi:signal transduction histidine kinase
MRDMWQIQTKNIAIQAKYSIIVENDRNIKKVIQTLDNPLILSVSVYAGKNLLYSSGKRTSLCGHEKEPSINIENYWCLYADVIDNQNGDVIGEVRLIVSKKGVKKLINKNLVTTVLVVSILTIVIFSVFYYLTNKLVKPLANLSSVIEKITEKERGIRINEEGTLDIQNIQKSFNIMILQIEEHENNLEEKVKERTLKLTQAYKKAQASSKIKTDILKITSHEMKTPLHSALYYLDLINSGEGNFISETEECLHRLQKQIHNILDYSKATIDKIELNMTFFSLPELFKKIEFDSKPLFDTSTNQLIIQCNFQEEIYSDEQLVKQIIANFISNANKFMDKGKVILSCDRSDNRLLISVVDKGCGIAAEDLKKVFDPFYQIDMSSVRRHEGTGLGLSICQLFAETINASITVKSKINKGSMFTLSIPLIK